MIVRLILQNLRRNIIRGAAECAGGFAVRDVVSGQSKVWAGACENAREEVYERESGVHFIKFMHREAEMQERQRRGQWGEGCTVHTCDFDVTIRID